VTNDELLQEAEVMKGQADILRRDPESCDRLLDIAERLERRADAMRRIARLKESAEFFHSAQMPLCAALADGLAEKREAEIREEEGR